MTQINHSTSVNKLSQLLRSDRKLFHTQDLALLWGVENRNTLYTVIKRFVKNGALFAVRKGLYSTIPLAEVDKLRLGPALIHGFCYLSCETVLAKEGVISQKIFPLTYVSAFSQKIQEKDTLFVYRKMNDKYLYSPEGVKKEGEIYVAEKERAVADMLYFNPKYNFDSPSFIDWARVDEIKKKVGY